MKRYQVILEIDDEKLPRVSAEALRDTLMMMFEPRVAHVPTTREPKPPKLAMQSPVRVVKCSEAERCSKSHPDDGNMRCVLDGDHRGTHYSVFAGRTIRWGDNDAPLADVPLASLSGEEQLVAAFRTTVEKVWTLAIPGLAPHTKLEVQYDERSKVAHVTTVHRAVDGAMIRHSMPFAPRDFGQLVRVVGGWPWRLTGE